jgi:hypothetical protein
LNVVADYLQKQHAAIRAADPYKEQGQAAFSMGLKRMEQANERIPDTHPELKALLTQAAQSPDLQTLKERMNTLDHEFTHHHATYHISSGPYENGVSVWNWNETEDKNGQAKYLAQITPDREIIYLDNNLPSHIKVEIAHIAQADWKQEYAIEMAGMKYDPPPPPKSPPTTTAHGEHVAAIEAKVKAGEAVNLSDVSDAIKKDKAAQSKQATQPGKSAAQGKTGQTRQYSKGKGATKKQEQPSIKDQIAAGKKQLSGRKPAPQKTATKNKNAGLGD